MKSLQKSVRNRQNDGTAIDFLRLLTSGLSARDPVRIPKRELLQHICEWRKCDRKQAEVILEEWESGLRKTILVGDWAVIYNIFTENLVVENLPSDGQIARAIELRSSNVRFSLRDTLEALSPHEFEDLLAELLSRVPWAKNVKVTKRSRDGGIDFVGSYVHEDADEIPLYGQAKHWQTKLDSPSVQGFIGSLATHSKGKPIMGLIYCTSGFSADAESEIKNSPIMIIAYDKDKLIDLMLRYEVGVVRARVESVSLDGRFWDEIKE